MDIWHGSLHPRHLARRIRHFHARTLQEADGRGQIRRNSLEIVSCAPFLVTNKLSAPYRDSSFIYPIFSALLELRARTDSTKVKPSGIAAAVSHVAFHGRHPGLCCEVPITDGVPRWGRGWAFVFCCCNWTREELPV